MPDTDPAAALDEIRKHYEVWGDASDVPRLLAALEAALAFCAEHELGPDGLGGHGLRMVSPADVRKAISRALLGEDGTDA